MKRSKNTYVCRSPISTVNSRDLTAPTRTQTSKQKYNDFTAAVKYSRQYRTPVTLLKDFQKELGRMLSRGR